MDYKKIGEFIASERKSKKMTQAKLAEKLFVSEKTISKWENGNGIPGTDTLPKLCEIFGITINEILSGERISNENYTSKAEDRLLELKKSKEYCDKLLLTMEIVISVLASVFLFALVFIAALVLMATWLRIVLIVCGIIEFVTAIGFAIKIEQKAGYYECKKCHHRYIPTFSQVLWAMHVNRTRYMKCPHCKHRSWNKKVVD